MDAATALDDSLDVELDILGQQSLLRIYTQLSFCFPVPDTAAHPAIIETLRRGLDRLSASFPWTAGQVVDEGATNESTGMLKIKSLAKTPPLIIKDLQDDSSAPTWEALQRTEFPMRLLDEDVIAPRRTLPGGPGWSPSDPEPVLLVQANFIRGGLILTFNGQHAVMDMTGQGEVIRLYNKACRGEAFTEMELKVGNMPRHGTVPLLDKDFKPGPELEDLLVKPPPVPPSDEDPGSPAKASWAYFSFDPSSLAALKKRASEDVSSGFVSLDDSLTAFIWQSTSRARVPRLGLSSPSMLARAVDVRGFVGVPSTYPGLLQTMTYSKSTIQDLVDKPLGATASQLRAKLDGPTLLHRTRPMATYLSRNPDKSGVSVSNTATVNPSTDVMLSSWCKVDCYRFDFNLGQGPPASVRRPLFTPVESLMYLMPKRSDGGISAAICLRDEDLERLRTDPLFQQYAKYIG